MCRRHTTKGEESDRENDEERDQQVTSKKSLELYIRGFCWQHDSETMLERRYYFFIVNERDRATLPPLIQAEVETSSTVSTAMTNGEPTRVYL